MRTYQEAREREEEEEERQGRVAGWHSERSERAATGIGEERNRERERAKRRDSWYSFDFGRAAVVSSGNPTFHSSPVSPTTPSVVPAATPSFEPQRRHHSTYLENVIAL